jgi:hypothetical protein
VLSQGSNLLVFHLFQDKTTSSLSPEVGSDELNGILLITSSRYQGTTWPKEQGQFLDTCGKEDLYFSSKLSGEVFSVSLDSMGYR